MTTDLGKNYASYFFYMLAVKNIDTHTAIRRIVKSLADKDDEQLKIWKAFLDIDEKIIFQTLLIKIYDVILEKVDVFIDTWNAGMKGGDIAALEIAHTFRSVNDMRNAYVWYMKSSSYGNVDATMYVAHCHLQGYGTKKDIHMATMIYYKLGYPLGKEPYPAAIHNLALIYELNGDKEKSIEQFKKACELNYAPSWRHLGKTYINEKKRSDAICCLRKGYELGDQMSGFYLACYPGEPVDNKTLLKLSNMGCVPASLVYAFQILTGVIPLGWREARKYFLISYVRSESGKTIETYCIHILRYLEFFGNGVDPRPDSIGEDYIAWSVKRRRITHSDPIEYARWYRDNGDMRSAHRYFRQTIDNKDSISPMILKEAYINLGYIYLFKILGIQYLHEAHEMFAMVIDLETNPLHKKGYIEAIIFIRKMLTKDRGNTKIVHDTWLAEGHADMAKNIQ